VGGAIQRDFPNFIRSGWIDPDNVKKYKKTAPDRWLEADGKAVKPEHKPFVLTDLLANRKDFLEEITAFEWVAEEISSSDCCMKYHCEIAGEGIELCWGFVKKYYRRKFTLQAKKQTNSKGVSTKLFLLFQRTLPAGMLVMFTVT